MYNKIMKKRLDQVVADRLQTSRNKAQNLIKNGCVFVDDKVQNKPSFEVEEYQNITIIQHDNYVSRGAYKLLKAFDVFGLNVEGKIVLDMGASTGGFTQVLIEKGADKILSVDVGKGEMDKTLAKHPKVVNMEGRDVRSLSKDEVAGCNLVVGDLSFISLKHILPHIKNLLGNIEMALLFKPQFECGREIAKKFRGVIKDKSVHKNLLKQFEEELKILDFTLCGLTESAIKGGSGNIEYLVHINAPQKQHFNIDEVVNDAFETL